MFASLTAWRRRLTTLFTRSRRERELDDEIRGHLEHVASRHIAAGMSEEEAWRAARRDFGGVDQVKEECRDARGLGPLEDLVQDLRFGARSLRRSPGFAIAALATLALGTAGPAGLLGAVRGMLLTPLPYPEPDRLVFLWQQDRSVGDTHLDVSPANFLDLRERCQSFERLAALEPYGHTWLSEGGPVSLSTTLVYEGFFDLLGVAPLLGRTFRPNEHRAGENQVLVLGHGLWRRRFGADSTVVGRLIDVDGERWRIVGVMPEDFTIPGSDLVWEPKVLHGWEVQERSSEFYTVVGRLKPGVSQRQASAELDVVAAGLAAEHPETNAQTGIAVVPLKDQLLGPLRTPLFVLLAAAVLFFLIACANLANLQLARATARSLEFAVRGALGAGRGRVTRQIVTESLLLGGIGSLLGFVLAGAALEVVRGLAPPEVPRLSELRADDWVLGLSISAALVATILTAIMPVGIASRASLRDRLSASSAISSSPTTRRVRSALVVAQVALSLVLLSGTGLLLKSFVTLLHEDLGFRTENVGVLVTQTWHLRQPGERLAFVDQVTKGIAALPGVQAVAVASSIPIAEGIGAEQATFRRPGETAAGSEHSAIATIVTADYFRTLGIPLLRGRVWARTTDGKGVPEALVNDTMARRYWGAENPLGRKLTLEFAGRSVAVDIVGVVGDVRREALNRAPEPTVYLPFDLVPWGANAFFVWTRGDPEALHPAAKRVIWGLQPTLAVDHEYTMAQVVADSVRTRRFILTLVGAFAALALALSTIGVIGVMSVIIGERSREFALRAVFGAGTRDILGLVLGQGMRLALLGIVLGWLGSMAATRVLAGMLYNVHPLDPATHVLGALVLLVAALVACCAPAFRAARLDPMTALKAE